MVSSSLDPAAATLRAPTSDTAPPLGPGARVAGRYVLGELLGEGTFGWVFAARKVADAHAPTSPRDELDERAAIKVLKPEHAADDSAFTRFKRRELALLQRVHTPSRCVNVVAPLEPDLVVHDGLAVLVLELVEGPSLHDLLARERFLDEAEARLLGAGIATGLARIHEVGGVHRDLKPENIRLRRGQPVILDLGIAKAMWETQTLTASGQGLMTPYYASPEQLGGRDVGPAADVYALGLILYEMLTGVVPLGGRSLVETIAARTTREAPDPRTVTGRAVSETLVRVVMACLARDPAARPTAARVTVELSRTTDPAAFAATERVVHPRRGRAPALVGGGALLVAAVGGGALLWGSARSSSERAPQGSAPAVLAPQRAQGAASISGSAGPETIVGHRPPLVVRLAPVLAPGAPLELEVHSEVEGPVMVGVLSANGTGHVLVPNVTRPSVSLARGTPLVYPSDAERRTVGAAASLPRGATATLEWIVAVVNPPPVPPAARHSPAHPFAQGTLLRLPTSPRGAVWPAGAEGACDLDGPTCWGSVPVRDMLVPSWVGASVSGEASMPTGAKRVAAAHAYRIASSGQP